MNLYPNRTSAGKTLADLIRPLSLPSPVLLAISRGGIAVAAILADSLGWTFQVLPLRPLALPQNPEDPFGCVDTRGEWHLNQALVGQLRVMPAQIRPLALRELAGIQRDLERWKIDSPSRLDGMTPILVDDGMHTGWTMFSGLSAARQLGANNILAACPVSHLRAFEFVKAHCSTVICPAIINRALFSIDRYYQDYTPISDVIISELPAKKRPLKISA
jgi:putative phosphoribosyl transferase